MSILDGYKNTAVPVHTGTALAGNFKSGPVQFDGTVHRRSGRQLIDALQKDNSVGIFRQHLNNL